MSNRFLLVVCGAVGVMVGIVALSPLTADDQPAKGAQAAGPGYVLAYKFHKGDVVRYESVQKSKFVSQFKGTAETSTNETHTRKAYRVVKVNEDGSAELETVIEWVKMIVDFGDGSVKTEFDSNDPGAKTQAKFADVYRNIGKPQARTQNSPSGKVLKVREMQLVTPAAAGAQLVKMKDMTGQDAYAFLTIFPDKPVKVGEDWKEKSEAMVTVDGNLKKPIDMERRYTLKSVDGDMATITFKTVILSPVKDNNIAIQLIQRETEGELVFDMKKGAVLSRNVSHGKSIINPAGNNTAMHSKGIALERLLTETAAISDIDTDTKKK